MTNDNIISAVRYILNEGRKRSADSPFRGLFLYDGKYIACDGYRLLRLNEDIPQLPHTQYKYFNSTKLISEAKKDGETLFLPTVEELKKFAIEQKQAAKNVGKLYTPRYCLNDYVWVKPYYLLDMLNALPDCVAYKPKSPRDPIYFKAENGDGLLVPIFRPRNL